ncbi:unnamed protein product [Pylaiella littoralis]
MPHNMFFFLSFSKTCLKARHESFFLLSLCFRWAGQGSLYRGRRLWRTARLIVSCLLKPLFARNLCSNMKRQIHGRNSDSNLHTADSRRRPHSSSSMNTLAKSPSKTEIRASPAHSNCFA